VKRSPRLKKTQLIETHIEVSMPHKAHGTRELGRPTPLVNEPLGNRQIEMVSVNSLKSAKRNARTHSKKQVEQIANSMRRFGVINPIIVDSQNQIVAGRAGRCVQIAWPKNRPCDPGHASKRSGATRLHACRQ
jgi:ParB-like nuclease domain